MIARLYPLLTAAALALSAPGWAQAAPPAPDATVSAPGATVTLPPTEDQGLTGTVSDEAQWQDLGIAITTFATDRDVPTQTNAGSTAALGRSVAGVISANLRNNGLFKPSGPQGLPQPLYAEVQAPNYSIWSYRSTEMLVQGYVRANPDGQLTIGCYLYDVALKQQLAKAGWGKKVLVIDGESVNGDFARAAGNLKDINVLPAIGANVYDILKHDTLVLTKAAVEKLEARFALPGGAD